MVLAAKVLNFVSGLIVLVTGVYVEVRFEAMLTEAMQIVIGAVAIAYFVRQLVRLTTRPPQMSTVSATSGPAREFSS